MPDPDLTPSKPKHPPSGFPSSPYSTHLLNLSQQARRLKKGLKELCYKFELLLITHSLSQLTIRPGRIIPVNPEHRVEFKRLEKLFSALYLDLVTCSQMMEEAGSVVKSDQHWDELGPHEDGICTVSQDCRRYLRIKRRYTWVEEDMNRCVREYQKAKTALGRTKPPHASKGEKAHCKCRGCAEDRASS